MTLNSCCSWVLGLQVLSFLKSTPDTAPRLRLHSHATLQDLTHLPCATWCILSVEQLDIHHHNPSYNQVTIQNTEKTRRGQGWSLGEKCPKPPCSCTPVLSSTTMEAALKLLAVLDNKHVPVYKSSLYYFLTRWAHRQASRARQALFSLCIKERWKSAS